jgi:hypothetical protein
MVFYLKSLKANFFNLERSVGTILVFKVNINFIKVTNAKTGALKFNV